MYQRLVTEMPFLGYWLTPVILYVLLAYGVLRWLQKSIVGDDSSPKEEKSARAESAVFFSKRLFIQFWTTLVIAACFVLVRILFGVKLALTSDALIIVGVGFINYFGAYNQWRAMSMSLSKSSVLTFGDDLGAMSLDAIFLGGLALLNFWSATGAVIACFAFMLFGLHSWQKKEPMQLFKYVAYFSVIWAIAIFAQRYYAFNRFPVEVFLLCWYAGAFIGALTNLLVMRRQAMRSSVNMNYSDVQRGIMLTPVIVCLASIVFALAIGSSYFVWKLGSPVVDSFIASGVIHIALKSVIGIASIFVAVHIVRIGLGSFFRWSKQRWSSAFPEHDTTSLRLLDVQNVGLLGLGIIACLAVGYWAVSLATLVVVSPILLVSEAIIPTIIGIVFFKEKSQFSKEQWGYTLLAIMGVTYIAIGYR